MFQQRMFVALRKTITSDLLIGVDNTIQYSTRTTDVSIDEVLVCNIDALITSDKRD